MIIKIISCVLVAVSVSGACCSKLMLKMRRKYFVLLWIYRLFFIFTSVSVFADCHSYSVVLLQLRTFT